MNKTKVNVHGHQLSRWQQKHAWTDDDKRFVLKNAGKMSVEDIAKELKRSVNSIKTVCSKIGVSYSFKG